MEITGEIGTFESRIACAPLNKHVLGWRRHFQWYVVALILVGGFAGSWVVDRFAPGQGYLANLATAVVGMFLLIRYAPRMAQDAWRKRGVPLSMDMTYRVEDDVLVIAGPTTVTRLAWWSLSEIIPGKGCWLFVGMGVAYFIPRRLFKDPADEAGFLRACLEKMSPEARARSPKAVAVAA